jgi:hypothetical protein
MASRCTGSGGPASRSTTGSWSARRSSLIDQTVYAQGIFVNIDGQVTGAAPLQLTNALELEIGRP